MILNLTQHNATKEQIEDGVIEPISEDKDMIKELLTVNELPTKEELIDRAKKLTAIAKKYDAKSVMIGGMPALMYPLANILENNDFEVLTAFTKRVVIELNNDDGTVSKKSVFKHAGFININQLL